MNEGTNEDERNTMKGNEMRLSLPFSVALSKSCAATETTSGSSYFATNPKVASVWRRHFGKKMMAAKRKESVRARERESERARERESERARERESFSKKTKK